ncbi:hypothetical protein A2U01_0109683, partial [Trifolium medium]|nr:hypothetical protein [Trifolium medium]
WKEAGGKSRDEDYHGNKENKRSFAGATHQVPIFSTGAARSFVQAVRTGGVIPTVLSYEAAKEDMETLQKA